MRPGRRASTTTPGSQLALVCVLAAVVARGLRAEDVVTLRAQSRDGGGRRIVGQIVDYNGRQLRIQVTGGREHSIGSEQIERIETNRTTEHNDGDGLFAAGDFRRAEAKYRAALERGREARPWMRRQILSQLVWCYGNTGQWEAAGEAFLTLVEGDPDTPFFDCIPLAWTAAQPSPALETKALAWLARKDNPVAMLLGASHLLATRARSPALDSMRVLASDRDPRVAWLAETQIWRIETVRATPSDLARWTRRLDAGPILLRAGPCFVLGSAIAAHDPQRAALALLEVPILYPRHRRLAAAALLSAGGCLEKTDHVAGAAELYRELMDGYGETTETGEAQRRLDQLARRAR
jgi:tetratricopeptide (TPR) repeat protein